MSMEMSLVNTDLDSVVEALAFAADEPVSESAIMDIYVEVTGRVRPSSSDITEAVERLNAVYAQTGRSFRLQRWAGGYRMATVPGVAPFLRVLFNQDRHRRLSASLLETLAVVTYRQPVTKPEVDFVRGVDSDYAIRRLMELGLVEVVGRSESVGKPILYGTTSQFLEHFGLDSLSDLPDLKEIEEILKDPHFDRERARLLSLEKIRDHDLAGEKQNVE